MALLQKTCSTGCLAGSKKARTATRAVVVARASELNRRDLLSGVVSTVGLLCASPALAAYGDSANVFGRTTNTTGSIPFAGDGFSLSIPARWNPSREQEFKNTVFRYVDNAAAANNLTVISEPTTKGKIEDFGSADDFLSQVGYLLGQQSYNGQTMSEGGFAPDRVAAASVLEVKSEADKKGRTSYFYEVLVRTADGDEGGKHQVIKATVASGKLWIVKAQIGDKRWFKGASKDALMAINSFTVA